ncbi:MAG: hypothetical protein K6U09_07350 [Acidobacteriia bacterium]|mgnify:CR=1 FL=1|jgi:ribonuclease E|nr:hypothetical protein [Terriglobia bacterium]
MADWRQIQARIRRAKAGKDPLGQLTSLYEKFHDAMVAYELGALKEAAGDRDEAARWYAIAAERFRRSDWKQKAQAALERLAGNGTGVETGRAFALEAAEEAVHGTAAQPVAGAAETAPAEELPSLETREAEPSEAPARKKRRRGRRGGRRHRKKREAARGAATGEPAPATTLTATAHPRPMFPPAAAGEPAGSKLERRYQARTGEPALASRLARLESKLRQFLAGAAMPLTLETADQAPVGPGVLLISDADQATHYYVEACDSLRAGIEYWLRSGRSARQARRGKDVRTRMAEQLGITESKLGDYLKRNCTVRWLQLDEGAAQLAHFAIAVLEPTLND